MGEKGETMPEDLRKEWGAFLNRAYKLWQKFWQPPTARDKEDAWWEEFLSYIDDLWKDMEGSTKPGAMEATMILYAIVAGAEVRAGKPRGDKEIDHWRRIQRMFAEKMGVPFLVEGKADETQNSAQE